MHQAKAQLSRLAALAREGEEVVICKSGQPWVRLTPYLGSSEPRLPGGFEGRIVVGPGFDAEDEETIASFEEARLSPASGSMRPGGRPSPK